MSYINQELINFLKKQEINRGFFDKSDPIEGIGIPLTSVSISRSYFIDPIYRDKLSNIKDELNIEIIKMINIGRIGDTNAQLIDYYDMQYKAKDNARRYLVVEHETIRGTLLTTLSRFYFLGDSFYIALDSYFLGPIHWTKFIIQILVSLIVLSIPNFLDLHWVFLIFPFLYLYSTWINVIRSIVQGVRWETAIRQKFNKSTSNSSFDLDDAMIHLKSVLPLILESVKNVFEKNGLEISGLEDEIHKINQQVINFSDNSTQVSTGGGNVVGSAIGGAFHRITGI